VRTRELVGVGVVHDDVPIARQRGYGAVAVVANGPRQAYGAVLVRILQAGIDQDRRRVAVEPLFQIFLGDSGDRHAANCRRVIAELSTGGELECLRLPRAELLASRRRCG